MTELEKFLEPIKVAGKSLGDKYQAYRIDGNSPQPDMRKDAGLGPCNSCDYFIFNNDLLIFIEETQLIWQIKDLKDEFGYLNCNQQTDFINKYIRNENKLKVYGSMLVLCRLSAQCKNLFDLLNNKKYSLWLIVSGMDKEEDARLFDHFKDKLLDDLRSVLTKNILDNVEIIPSKILITRLSK